MNERCDALDGLRGHTWNGTTIMAVMHSRALLYYDAVGWRESFLTFLAFADSLIWQQHRLCFHVVYWFLIDRLRAWLAWSFALLWWGVVCMGSCRRVENNESIREVYLLWSLICPILRIPGGTTSCTVASSAFIICSCHCSNRAMLLFTVNLFWL